MIETVTNDALFEFDLQQVDVARWLDIGQPGTRAERRQWRQMRRDDPAAGGSAGGQDGSVS